MQGALRPWPDTPLAPAEPCMPALTIAAEGVTLVHLPIPALPTEASAWRKDRGLLVRRRARPVLTALHDLRRAWTRRTGPFGARPLCTRHADGPTTRSRRSWGATTLAIAAAARNTSTATFGSTKPRPLGSNVGNLTREFGLSGTYWASASQLRAMQPRPRLTSFVSTSRGSTSLSCCGALANSKRRLAAGPS